MEWAILPFKKFADFSGRARRKEYWSFVLLYVVAVTVASLIGSAIKLNFLVVIVYLGFIVPLLACGARRMHDTDHSGWWLLAPIVPLVFALMEGTPGPNRFGDDPKGGTAPGTFN